MMRVSARSVFGNMVLWFAVAYCVKWLLDQLAPESRPRPWTDIGIFAVLVVSIVAIKSWRSVRTSRQRASNILFLLRYGAHDEAIEPLREMLRECEELQGPTSDNALYWRHRLADTLAHVGDTAEALALAAGAMSGREALHGFDHPETLESRQLYEELLRREAGGRTDRE
ncbi:tetratricopeptide repeat protein [Nocardia crassostreae]|uniref:tetratricopeptide repeat protein n=1 Tax=Nocardia crassostreae TaxID=53428 RepID=UPI0008361030|nr:tetratricopeptide repeat protein [Nocardia crassostreae]